MPWSDLPDVTADEPADEPEVNPDVGRAGSSGRLGARNALLDTLAEVLGDERFDWHSQANCQGLDPDMFFPERGASTREAKKVCAECAVKDDCLEWALASGEKFGIWGGTSERERRRLRKDRRAAARRPTAA